MTPELLMLIYSTILYFIWIMIPAAQAVRENGAKAQAGPRDKISTDSVFIQRGRRLSANMQENLIIFAILILVSHVTGHRSEITILGAQLFFFARVLHGIIYLVGWPLIRPLAWFAGLVGQIMILTEIFTI